MFRKKKLTEKTVIQSLRSSDEIVQLFHEVWRSPNLKIPPRCYQFLLRGAINTLMRSKTVLTIGAPVNSMDTKRTWLVKNSISSLSTLKLSMSHCRISILGLLFSRSSRISAVTFSAVSKQPLNESEMEQDLFIESNNIVSVLTDYQESSTPRISKRYIIWVGGWAWI